MNTNFQDEYRDEYANSHHLKLNEKYFPNYYRHIVNLLLSNLEKQKNILDFGAGIGSLATICTKYYGVRPICAEVDQNHISILENRGFTTVKSLNDSLQKYQYIYTSNVLEHIKDDASILKLLYQKLEKNGVLAIYVPACKFLYGPLDISVGHYRRYNKTDLSKLLINAGFKIQKCEYSDSIGLLIWLLYKILGTKKFEMSEGGGEMKFYDSILLPISNILDYLGMKYIAGKSLYVIAIKE